MENHSTPKRVIKGWEESKIKSNTMIKEIWDKYKYTVINNTKESTKKQIYGACMKDLEEKLSECTKIPKCMTKYKRSFKTKHDPIISKLDPMELTMWLNISNAQRDDRYEDKCQLCGENDSLQHAYCECDKLKHMNSALEDSYNTELNVYTRYAAVKDIIWVHNQREMIKTAKKHNDTENEMKSSDDD